MDQRARSETAADLNPGTQYTVDFTFDLSCLSAPVTGAITFVDTTPTETHTISGTLFGAPLNVVDCAVTGSATLTGSGSTLPITFTPSALTCTTAGCPATIGFWKNHPFPSSVESSGLTLGRQFGGVTYSPADLLTILNAQGGGNAVSILGKQLIGALLNLAAGAAHITIAEAAIATSEALLAVNSVDLLTSDVSPSTALGTALVAQSTVLAGFNSADFNTCQEGSGLAP